MVKYHIPLIVVASTAIIIIWTIFSGHEKKYLKGRNWKEYKINALVNRSFEIISESAENK